VVGRPSPASDDTKVIVPSINKDPVWSLRPWPATLLLAGVEHEIPALTAADWLAYLMQPQPDLDGFILEHIPASDELLVEGAISLEQLYDACMDLITTVCAREWWIALRLVNIARTSWGVLGPQMIEKVDPERISISAWLDVLLVVVLQSMEPKETTMFSMRLEAPPPQVRANAPEPMEQMEMDRGSFLSMG
jgi:hypothetical protein